MTTPRPFPALGLDPVHEEALCARLRPFYEAHAISSLACLTAAAVARRLQITDLDVLLAFSLAYAATEHGHTGLRLTAVPTWLQGRVRNPTEVRSGAPAQDADLPALLPADRAAWRAKLAASPGVSVAPALFVLEGDLLQVQRMAAAELRIAARLETLATHSTATYAVLGATRRAWLVGMLDALTRKRDDGTDRGIDRQQLAAIRLLSNHLTVVTGGPGMGKTVSIRAALLALWWAARWEQRGVPRVALAAPTGKAAARMREAIQDGLAGALQDVAAHAAAPRGEGAGTDAETPTAAQLVDQLGAYLGELQEFTIHRLLGSLGGRAGQFQHHAANPLPYDVVVVDEASMADVQLMDALLDAIDPRTTRLVLAGDRNQLASVDAGTVLADICGPVASQSDRLAPALQQLAAAWGLAGSDDAAQLPDRPLAAAVVPFRKFFRFANTSGVGALARSVIQYDPENWPVDEVLSQLRTTQDSFVWNREGTDASRRDAALAAATSAYAALPLLADRVFQVDGGRQLLAPDAAAWAALQKTFDTFRLLTSHRGGPDGVRALNRALVAALHAAKAGAGDATASTPPPFWVGQPLLVTQNDYTLGLYNGDIGFVLQVKVEGAAVATMAVFRVQRGVDSYWRILAPSRLTHVETALAMTIHKCQGSQFDTVALLLPRQHSPLLTRELVYTGLTRARGAATLYGSEAVVAASLTARVQRDAGLAVRLWGNG